MRRRNLPFVASFFPNRPLISRGWSSTARLLAVRESGDNEGSKSSAGGADAVAAEGGAGVDADANELGWVRDVGRGCRRGLPRGRFCECAGLTSRVLTVGRCFRPERLHPLRISSRVWPAGYEAEPKVLRRLCVDAATASGLAARFRFVVGGGAEVDRDAVASFLPTAWRSLFVLGRGAAGSAGVLSRGVGTLAA